jgi:NAD(P)-dependent dehydrogenase (short-subunit alcohol dehydrogenase family)
MQAFKGRVAVVTGAGSGIGAAVSRALGKAGAHVVCTDRSADAAGIVAQEICAAGGMATGSALDVTSAGAVAEVVARTLGEHRTLDLMFNNAGISVAGEARDIDLSHWRQVLDVNLMGVVHGCDAAYRAMVRQGYGHIVNIASLAGLIPFPSNVPYATSKHAVVGLSLSLRAEGVDLGVRVSAVCPGFIQTNIFQSTPFIRVDRERAMKNIPFPPIPAERAAQEILRGVARNRAIIVFPGYARLLWTLQCLIPSALNPLHRKSLRDLRRLRTG